MINFAPEPRSFYIYEGMVGPGAQKGISDEEWNMHAVTSRALIAYEIGRKPGQRLGHFDKSLTKAVKLSMHRTVSGHTVEEWMQTSTPEDFFEACRGDRQAVDELPICSWYGNASHFMTVLRARVATWKKANKKFLTKEDRDAMTMALRGI